MSVDAAVAESIPASTGNGSVVNAAVAPMTLRQTPLTCSGHTRPVVFLAFSNMNQEWLSDSTEYEPGTGPPMYYSIAACKDGRPMLRYGETGDWIGTFDGHKGAVGSADLSSDARLAATGGADFTARIWNTKSGDNIATISQQHIVKSVHFAADATRLAVAANDKTVSVFDVQQPESGPVINLAAAANMKQVIYGHLSGENKLISCSDESQSVHLWDVRSGSEVHQIKLNIPVGGIELSRDDKHDVLTVAAGTKVMFYDANKCELIKEVDCGSAMFTASLSKDRSMFVCAGEDFKIYRYDYQLGKEIESFKGHFGPVHCIRFSPDDELYASGSEDGTLRLWQTEVGKTYGLWKVVDTSVKDGT